MTLGIDPHVHTRMPRSELERRWEVVRAHLVAHGLDALVIMGSDDFLGGYVRWFIDRPAYNAYHVALIFFPRDLMTLVEHGPLGAGRYCDGSDPDYPGVGQILHTAAFRSIHHLHGAEGELVRATLRRRGCRRIGFVSIGAMPHAFVTTIMDSPGIVVSDETIAIDRFKTAKSAAEISEIRKTAAMQDTVFQHVLDSARPGMRDVDIAALAQAESRRLGSEGGVVLCGSAPPGAPAVLRLNHWQMRPIERGDAVTLLIESNGPAGYYTELGRTFVFGRAHGELRDAFELACEAQAAALGTTLPGTPFTEIAAAHDRFMGRRGLPAETRLFAHGQGYDLVESPLLRADQPGVLQQDTSIVVHPAFVRDTAFGYVCDNYIIGANGASPCLHATEKKIFECV